MSDLCLQIWVALFLDLLLGDPRWFPHPVRLMGNAALKLEGPARRFFKNPRLAGIFTALLVIGGTVFATWLLLRGAGKISVLLKQLLSVFLLYTAFAARDLADHARRVFAALQAEDLPRARHAVSYMVGRDTASLDESGITRAAVESVAENTVDGVLSPLFFAFLFGPVGAMAFKAISTLDSTFGYRNDRYRYFGWASARIDDVANFVPARLSLLFIAAGALFTGNRPLSALRIASRDGRKHQSPNAGLAEAAFAGALGVQLGGKVLRNGEPHDTPLLGDPARPLSRNHIRRANALMAATTAAAAVFMTLLRQSLS